MISSGRDSIKGSILIVDDESVICEGVERLLADDYNTYHTVSAKEALNIVRDNSDIDVILCDLIMPEMDGNEMIEKIRSENKEIHLIVMTAYADPLKVCDAMKKGANTFLLKPLDISLLERSVKNAVQRKRELL